MDNQDELLSALEKWIRDIVREEMFGISELAEELTKIGGSI